MKDSNRLLETTAADIMRHISNADYEDAVHEVLSLTTPIAATYCVAVVVEGMTRAKSRAFVAALTDAVNEKAAKR